MEEGGSLAWWTPEGTFARSLTYLYEPDLHAKEVDSLADATLGVIDQRVAGRCGNWAGAGARHAVW